MIAFIDEHRATLGVEPICRLLQIAPSTYCAHVVQRDDPAKASARSRRDAKLSAAIKRVFEANFEVYGARKIWRQLSREGIEVALRITTGNQTGSVRFQTNQPPANPGRFIPPNVRDEGKGKRLPRLVLACKA